MTPPVRIAVFCGGSYVSGLEIMALHVMQGLRERGHELYCITNAWNDGVFLARLDQIEIHHTSAHLGKFSISLRPRSLWWTLNAALHLPAARRKLRKSILHFNPDVAIVYNRDLLLLARGVLSELPTVFHVHELADESAASRWLLRRADRVVNRYAVVSEHLKHRLTAQGIAATKITVVHNGIRTNSNVVRHHADSRIFTVGIIGQIGAWKGHEDLLEAIRILKTEARPVRCLIFGHGVSSYVEELKQTAERYGIASQVEWRGFVNATDEIYSEIDVCVVPSRFDEPFGLVAAEAGAHGIPVIATRRGGLVEIVRDGETGFLIPQCAPAAIAERILQLMDDAGLWMSISTRAREHILANFAERQMIDRIDEMCRQIAVPDTSPSQRATVRK